MPDLSNLSFKVDAGDLPQLIQKLVKDHLLTILYEKEFRVCEEVFGKHNSFTSTLYRQIACAIAKEHGATDAAPFLTPPKTELAEREVVHYEDGDKFYGPGPFPDVSRGGAPVKDYEGFSKNFEMPAEPGFQQSGNS